MHRVEQIAAILKNFIVQSLTSPVGPDGNKRQQRQPLPLEKHGFAKQDKFKPKTAQQFQIDIQKTQKLTEKTPPGALVKEIKHQYSKDARVQIVHHGQQTGDVTDQHGCGTDQDPFPQLAGPNLLVPMDQPQGDQEAPQNILVQRVEQTASQSQVEWDLGQDRKQQQPQRISFQVAGVKITLHD